MKIKKYLPYISIIMFFLSVVVVSTVGETEEDTKEAVQQRRRRLLRGSKGVFVDVEVVLKEDESLQKEVREQLKTEVELELRKYGIKIFSAKEFSTTFSIPRLEVRLGLVQEFLSLAQNQYIFGFHIQHLEYATLFNKEETEFVQGICWIGGMTVGRNEIKDIKEHIMNQVRTYINDYLAANPKTIEVKNMNNN